MARLEGNSGNLADVDNQKRLLTSSTTETELEYASEKQGKAYSISSTYTTSGGDEEALYIQNTSTIDNFIIDEIFLGGSVNHLWTMSQCSGTPGGAGDVTVKNLNLGSGNSAAMIAKGDASVTGLTLGDRMILGRTIANDSKEFQTGGAIVLGQDDAVSFTASGTGDVSVTIVGHYKVR
jgi:hypothetical protein